MSAYEKLPLFPSPPAQEEYPVECLGPLLSSAALAISCKIQVPVALAAQSVLAAASLVTQPLADVMMPFGQTRPLSLFFITVAGSGDRKTTSDSEAIAPIMARENSLASSYEDEYADWKDSIIVWKANHRKIANDYSIDQEERKENLKQLGPEPAEPTRPVLIAAEPTLEGLVQQWTVLPAALGIFSAEGGQFMGGHAMSQDSRLRTAAGLSDLWDGKNSKRIRVNGVSSLRGRRLSIHLMVQPDASAAFLNDPVLRDQGFLSRVLVSSPISLAGTRMYKSPTESDEIIIKNYHDRIAYLLDLPWPLHNKTEGLKPRVLEMNDMAVKHFATFHDFIEKDLAPSRKFHEIKDLASKASEHASRIAGVITLINNDKDTHIYAKTLGGATRLTYWYLNETLRLRRVAKVNLELVHAKTLLDWITEVKKGEAKFSEIMQLGPSSTRLKTDAEAAVRRLIDHELIYQCHDRPRTLKVR